MDFASFSDRPKLPIEPVGGGSADMPDPIAEQPRDLPQAFPISGEPADRPHDALTSAHVDITRPADTRIDRGSPGPDPQAAMMRSLEELIATMGDGAVPPGRDVTLPHVERPEPETADDLPSDTPLRGLPVRALPRQSRYEGSFSDRPPTEGVASDAPYPERDDDLLYDAVTPDNDVKDLVDRFPEEGNEPYHDSVSDHAEPAREPAEPAAGEEPPDATGERPDRDRPRDEAVPSVADRPQEAVPRSPEDAEDPPVAFVWPEPKAVAELFPEMERVTQWHRLVEQRMSQVAELVDRVRQLPVVRANPNLVDELKELRLADPDACLRTLGCVLAEVLELRSAPDSRDDFDKRVASLGELADKAGRLRPEVVVSPDARGEIDGCMPAEPVSDVEVRDSMGVMWGAHNRLRVEHLCVVESPVIEVAELIDMDDGKPVFDWSAWRFISAPRTPRGPAGGVVEASARLREGYWANIWNCTGVSLGDRNTLDLTYVYRMASCRVNLVPLLSDPTVRADLALCRDDSPENAEQAQEARHRLPLTVAAAVQAIDVSSLVSEDEIAGQAVDMRQPQVRGRARGIVITHGIGVALGIDPAVSWRRTTRVHPIRVR
jgi:hypothetical protein